MAVSENNNTLAENKVLILYILKSVLAHYLAHLVVVAGAFALVPKLFRPDADLLARTNEHHVFVFVDF